MLLNIVRQRIVESMCKVCELMLDLFVSIRVASLGEQWLVTVKERVSIVVSGSFTVKAACRQPGLMCSLSTDQNHGHRRCRKTVTHIWCEE